MKYLKKFASNTEYQAFLESADFVVPNVSLLEDTGKVKYLAKIPPTLYSYIKGDGSAYIILDYYLSNYDRIEVVRQGGASAVVTLGAKSSKMMATMLINQDRKGYFIFRTSTSHFLEVGDTSTNVPYVMGMVKEGDKYYDKVLRGDYNYTLYTHSTPPEEVFSDIKLRVFAGTLQDSEEVDSRIFSGRIYSLKIIDARDERVKINLVPAEEDGVPGMYDLVNSKFYANANSAGAFTLG